MKRTRLLALAIVLLVACSDSDSPTGLGDLNTTVRSESNGSWPDGPSVSGTSWRLVDLEGWYQEGGMFVKGAVRVSYTMTWTNNDPSRAVTIYYTLHFLDAAGFELAKTDSYATIPVTIPAASSAQVGAMVDLDNVTEVSLANQISKMDVWAGFTFN